MTMQIRFRQLGANFILMASILAGAALARGALRVGDVPPTNWARPPLANLCASASIGEDLNHFVLGILVHTLPQGVAGARGHSEEATREKIVSSP